MSKKNNGVNPALEKAISDLLEQTMKSPEASLTDKVKILDRALKLEAIKQKFDTDQWGSAFTGGDDE